MKDLPKVFANEVKEGSGNNSEYSYERHEESSHRLNEDNRTIEQKLHSIFSNEHYIYKIKVAIIRNGRQENKTLIGYNKNAIITYENEQIPISEIQDIYLLQ